MLPEAHFGALRTALGGLGFETAAMAGVSNTWRRRNIRRAEDLAQYIRRIGAVEDRRRIAPRSEFWGYASRMHA
eukprot:6066182-Lingulodinium_polyedra.AAC.1